MSAAGGLLKSRWMTAIKKQAVYPEYPPLISRSPDALCVMLRRAPPRITAAGGASDRKGSIWHVCRSERALADTAGRKQQGNERLTSHLRVWRSVTPWTSLKGGETKATLV
ncbi:hypothetical protein AAFF_G00159160 [Aldrovandia affinis]|uniref:Uncharacterized protein n=1 Tax=Aldrovandia affinis TaxID=143900 RepID=A0AAD7RN73_9TELE|nr:hypothetical protein AAFF_G00159160 [Aldrovandia affinis]